MLRIRGSQGRHGGKLAIALLLLGVLAFVSPLPRASYAVTSLILDTSSPSALHQSTTDCAVAGGSWSNGTLTCTVTGTGAIYSGGFLSVQSGATLDITPGADFHAFGDVGVVLGAIKIGENANLSIGSSGRLDNSEANGACGSVTNNGNISNEGTIGSSCTFVNKGEIDNLDGAFIYAGSYGGAGATFDNQGTIINSHGGALQDDSNGTGVLNNAGTIVNDGFLQLYSGDTVMAQGRNGHWYFQGSFASSGNLQMSSGSTLTVGYGGYTTVPTTLDITSGTFRIPYGVTLYVASSAKLFVDAEAAIDNYGYLSLQSGQAFYRAGNVTNSGVITNYNGGTVNDNGTITNEEGATVNNTSGADFVSRGYDGIMYNHGAFYNGKEGIVDLQAYAIINNDGPIEDAGTFAISENATLTNNSGGRVSVNGTLDNSGTVSNNGGGVLNVNGFLSNSGVVNSSAGASIRVNPRGAVNSTGIIRSSGSFKILPGATVATGAGGLLATSGSLIDSGTLNVAQEASLN
ncbi:MAG TPA: hypothetical protein VKF15_03075, partial [Nitrososphaerales archaeon]|nr:hypothetical protein [Nitrososphaerales archaeon]